ncbi:MAG: MarR family transcriptional regulator [Gammaproteobacteria bacterium]|nr:MarR family transcriptional regulator [Gammaproteobacteria bacterium]
MANIRLTQNSNPNGKQGPGGLVTEDGDQKEGFVAYHPPRRKNGFEKEGFVAMSKTAMDLMAEDSELQGADLRVLLKMLARLDFENWILVAQTEISRELGMKPQNVSRSIKRLTDKGLLLKGPRSGLNQAYRLNPEVGWMGSNHLHKGALSEQGDSALREAKRARLCAVVSNKRKDGSET